MNKNKKIVAAVLLGAAVWALPTAQAPVEAAESSTAQPAAAAAEKKVYTYVSKEYGYGILCPAKPNVVPASMFYEDETKKGEVLIFDNDGYNVKHAWVVLVDAFDDKGVPDLNKLSEEEAKAQLTKIQQSNGYEGIALLSISENNKAIFAVTAKEVEIDTNGDGQPDTTAVADTQMAVSFFRGPKGGRYSVQLIDNPVLRQESINEYQ
ncbi:MAG: hypothetical protein IJT01_04055, partial [Selenomonadaceae bacterium]|nr:hypothetical protein [Selenomonadaceae bacterium]